MSHRPPLVTSMCVDLCWCAGSSRGALRRNVPQVAAQLLAGHVRLALFLHVPGFHCSARRYCIPPDLSLLHSDGLQTPGFAAASCSRVAWHVHLLPHSHFESSNLPFYVFQKTIRSVRNTCYPDIKTASVNCNVTYPDICTEDTRCYTVNEPKRPATGDSTTCRPLACLYNYQCSTHRRRRT